VLLIPLLQIFHKLLMPLSTPLSRSAENDFRFSRVLEKLKEDSCHLNNERDGVEQRTVVIDQPGKLQTYT